MTEPASKRAEGLVDAALDLSIDAMVDGDLDLSEAAMRHAMCAAWILRQREALALSGLDLGDQT